MEPLIAPVEIVRNNPSVSSASVIEKHIPCSFCAVVVGKGNPKLLMVKLFFIISDSGRTLIDFDSRVSFISKLLILVTGEKKIFLYFCDGGIDHQR